MAQVFQTLSQYTKLAEKVIAYHGGRNRDWLLRNEEAIGIVAHEMMMADWRWRPNRGRNRNSFRINAGRFAVKNFVRNTLASQRKETRTINAKFIDPRNEEWKQARVENIERCAELVRLAGLTEVQQRVIDMYYFQEMKIPAIAEELGVKNQAVQQALDRARNRMKRIGEIEV